MALPHDPATRHRLVSRRFTDLVRGTTDWSRPTPVAEWTALDVVDHLVSWLPGFLAGGTPYRWEPGPAVTEDPLGAWQAQTDGVQSLLEDPEAAGSPFNHPRAPGQDLAGAINQFYTADVFMHSWDLARATGQDDTLDAETSGQMLAGMLSIEPLLRQSGQFGTPQPVPEGASPGERLIAFIGRDPGWTAPDR